MAQGGVLGIVSCVVLADELAYVLSKDPAAGRLLVIDSDMGRVLREKLERTGLSPTTIAESSIGSLGGAPGLTVLISVNAAGPHDNVNELRDVVVGRVRQMAPYVDALLVFYGLCRNSLYKISKVGEEVNRPIMLLTDAEGMEVDDCFGANLGGKRAYLEAIKSCRGTIFVSAGYAENWARRQSKKDFVRIIEQVENMRFVFEYMGYNKVMKLETGVGDQATFAERVSGFAKIFDFSILTRKCSLEVFDHSYALAKRMISEGAMVDHPESEPLTEPRDRPPDLF